MNHEALNMTNTTDQTTEVTKKVEAEPRPLLLFQKLGATANALVAAAKTKRLNRSLEKREERQQEDSFREEYDRVLKNLGKQQAEDYKRLYKEFKKHKKVLIGGPKNELMRDRLKTYLKEAPERYSYPEVFSEIDMDAIDGLQSESLEKLESLDWVKITDAYGRAYRLRRPYNTILQEIEGRRSVEDRLFPQEQQPTMLEKMSELDKDLVGLISSQLGINSPDVTYGSVDSCGYNVQENTILLDNHYIHSIGVRIAEETGVDSIIWLTVSRIQSIAHELWHAFQNNGSIPKERKDLYAINDRLRVQPEIDYFGYRSQLKEAESYRFEKKVSDILLDQLFSHQSESETT